MHREKRHGWTQEKAKVTNSEADMIHLYIKVNEKNIFHLNSSPNSPQCKIVSHYCHRKHDLFQMQLPQEDKK